MNLTQHIFVIKRFMECWHWKILWCYKFFVTAASLLSPKQCY